jgi:hypothetical protein
MLTITNYFKKSLTVLGVLIAASVFLINIGCGGVTAAQKASNSASAQPVQVTPSTVSAQPGATQQFSATVAGSTNSGFTWYATGGTISSGGLYTAPSAPGTYTVQATSAADTSKFGTAMVTVVGSPTSPQAHSVDLTWSPSTSNVVGYLVYRGTVAGGPYTRLITAADPATTYSDSSVQSGTTYYYVVTAVDGNGAESGFSNQATATVPAS